MTVPVPGQSLPESAPCYSPRVLFDRLVLSTSTSWALRTPLLSFPCTWLMATVANAWGRAELQASSVETSTNFAVDFVPAVEVLSVHG